VNKKAFLTKNLVKMNQLKNYEQNFVYPELLSIIPEAQYFADLPFAEEIVFRISFPRFINTKKRKSLIPGISNILAALTRYHIKENRKVQISFNRRENLYAGLRKNTPVTVQSSLKGEEVYSFLEQYRSSMCFSSLVPNSWSWNIIPINAKTKKGSTKRSFWKENYEPIPAPYWCVANINWEDFHNLIPELYDLTFPLIEANLLLSMELKVGVRLPEMQAVAAVQLWENAIGLKI
jgi:hypothetical protein